MWKFQVSEYATTQELCLIADKSRVIMGNFHIGKQAQNVFKMVPKVIKREGLHVLTGLLKG
jgi:hypothetical protein